MPQLKLGTIALVEGKHLFVGWRFNRLFHLFERDLQVRDLNLARNKKPRRAVPRRRKTLVLLEEHPDFVAGRFLDLGNKVLGRQDGDGDLSLVRKLSEVGPQLVRRRSDAGRQKLKCRTGPELFA